MFREGLAPLLDQNDGDVYSGTERVLTYLWPLKVYERGRERERSGGKGELHRLLWEQQPPGLWQKKTLPGTFPPGLST